MVFALSFVYFKIIALIMTIFSKGQMYILSVPWPYVMALKQIIQVIKVLRIGVFTEKSAVRTAVLVFLHAIEPYVLIEISQNWAQQLSN